MIVMAPLAHELVEVDLGALGVWHALYRRGYSLWAAFAAKRILDDSHARELAHAACASALARPLT